MGVPMEKSGKVSWYRSPVSRENMAKLNERSDVKGFLQTGGYLGLLMVTGGAILWSIGHFPWYVSVLLFFIHATFFHFLVNGFHELVHDSVFKTKALNRFFLRVLSFLGWFNHHGFWASHTEHHKFTLHPPDDLEVVLPQKMTLRTFLTTCFIQPTWIYYAVKSAFKVARGRIEGEWYNHLFPESKPEARRRYRHWARILLIGHFGIAVVSFSLGFWFVPLVVSLPLSCGRWLHFLCNGSQHIGLRDKVSDFRLCCRTIILNPFVRFLYWHMNYHTEHHMYAAVPCYNLGKLHALIRHDLPYCPKGLFETWMHIGAILKKQKINPAYQFTAEIPGRMEGREVRETAVLAMPVAS